jgi:hypothetical protein
LLTQFALDTDDTQTAEAETRWVNKNSPFMARFLTSDLCSDLRQHSDLLPEFGRFSLIMSTDTTLEKIMFRSCNDLLSVLTNISNLLAPNGYFVGMAFDSGELWNRSIHTLFSNANAPKSYFHAASNHIRFDFKRMSYITSMDASSTVPAPDQLFSEWLPNAPTLGIEVTVNMEQKEENLFVVHSTTLIEAAKLVGLTCLSFRNLNEFYETFKHREEDQLRKLQVFTKSFPKIMPEQKDAVSLYSVFVFQKI